MPLPYPLDDPAKDHAWTPLSEQVRGEVRVHAGRHLRGQHPAAEDQGGGGRAGREVPLRPGKALHQGEQLDVPAAAVLLTWSTAPSARPAPRPATSSRRAANNELYRPTYPLRDRAPALLQVRQARRPALGLAARRHRAQLAAGRAARSSWPIAATSAGAAPRPARSASTTAWSPTNSASSSARRWASPPRSSTTTAPCSSSRSAPRPA